MKNIKFVEAASQQVIPTLKGITSSSGLSLYQKILTLMLSSQSALYRSEAGASLLQLLSGANIPSDDLLTSAGALACAQVKACLDFQDVKKLASLTAQGLNGHLYINVVLEDGESYTGVLT